MAHSKREKLIAITSGAILALIVAEQLVIEPLWARRTELNTQIEKAETQRDQDAKMIETAERASKYWTEMSAKHLPQDSYEADQMLNNLSDWAQESGLSLSSVKSERTEKDKDFYRKSFRATGSGGMSQTGRFLYRIQTATGAARITDFTLSSRKDGVDDLGLSVAVTTIYPVADADKSRATASAAEGTR